MPPRDAEPVHDECSRLLAQGLGVDACHCMECNTCMALSEYASHKCRPLSACPVCTDPLFHSSQPFRVRPCGLPRALIYTLNRGARY